MTLSQVQIIQSFGEALSWFERELSWGVSASELPHLTGRIGELYAAMVTRGQMAIETNQRGYDVISAERDRISVKTITTSNHVVFNENTFSLVDRVMIFRINVEETEASIEEILDCSSKEAREKMQKSGNKLLFYPRDRRKSRDLSEIQISAEIKYKNFCVKQFEDTTIIVERDGSQVTAMPALREIAGQIGVSPLNGKGGKKNTRTLGADLIKALGHQGT